VREDAGALVAALRDAGVAHVAMVTGDRAAIAEPIGAALGLDAVHADRTPEGKLDVVRGTADRPVMMVGDGVNDAHRRRGDPQRAAGADRVRPAPSAARVPPTTRPSWSTSRRAPGQATASAGVRASTATRFARAPSWSP